MFKKTNHSSAHPTSWPGIKGRSEEHEGHPDSPAQGDRDAEVTEQQRRLEQAQREVERK